MKVTFVKKSSPALKNYGAKLGSVPATTDFILVDNQDDTCTVNGVDAAGFPVDISAVASLAVTSSDPSTLSVDPPVGMTFKMHGLKPSVVGAPVDVVAVATWNDPAAGIGPFSIMLPVAVTGDVATGIVIVVGTPTVR